jgi:hypothetical protein
MSNFDLTKFLTDKRLTPNSKALKGEDPSTIKSSKYGVAGSIIIESKSYPIVKLEGKYGPLYALKGLDGWNEKTIMLSLREMKYLLEEQGYFIGEVEMDEPLEENIVPLKSIGIWIDTEEGTVYPMDKDGGWDRDNPMTLDQVDFYDMDDVSEEDYQVYLSVVKALQA